MKAEFCSTCIDEREDTLKSRIAIRVFNYRYSLALSLSPISPSFFSLLLLFFPSSLGSETQNSHMLLKMRLTRWGLQIWTTSSIISFLFLLIDFASPLWIGIGTKQILWFPWVCHVFAKLFSLKCPSVSWRSHRTGIATPLGNTPLGNTWEKSETNPNLFFI